MSVGYLLLYAALAMVALWLLAELLLQYRAPLVWRALTLGGFLAVVAGMRLGSVLVIGAGAAGFGVGQVLVTLSVKRGYAAGWSLRRPDGSLPGPLARIPLLSAATGGTPLALPELVEPVGEVGPVELEPSPVPSVETDELVQDGVYVTAPEPEPAYYQPQPDQQQYYYYPQDHQQVAYPQEAWAQQPAFGYDPGYQQAYQTPYQDPYGQPQYQDAYAQQLQAQQQWQYQQQYPADQYGYPYQQQSWQYQQQ